MKSPKDKKITDLEHEVHILKQKLQMAELATEIEKKKRERIEAGKQPWATSTGWSELFGQLGDSYKGKHSG